MTYETADVIRDDARGIRQVSNSRGLDGDGCDCRYVPSRVGPREAVGDKVNGVTDG